MIGRLLPLRLLRSAIASTSVSAYSRSLSVGVAWSIPCQSSIPFRAGDELLGARFFSVRAPSSRTGRGGAQSDRRGGVGSRSSAATGQAKSLIEDEEELSDWISDLKTDSFRLGLSSDDEEADRSRSRSGIRRDKGPAGDGFRARDKKGDSVGTRRMRDDDSDDFSEFSNSRTQNSRRKTPSKTQRDDDSDDLLDFSGGQRSRDVRGKPNSRRHRNDYSDDFSEFSSSGRSQNSRGKRSLDSYLDDSEDVDNDDDDEKLEASFRGKRGGMSGGGRSSTSSRGRARHAQSGFRKSKNAPSPVLLPSEQEDEDEEDEDEEEEDCDLSTFDDNEGQKEASFKDALKAFGSDEENDGDAEQPTARKSSGEDDSYLSQTRFYECSISPLTLKGIKAAGYEKMTVVQEATLPVILKGKDVLAKAKTGTGKTVAFLLPAIEVVTKLPPANRDQNRPPINVLVVCPTRELADQAAAEANKLLKYHPSIGVQVVMGGTRLALEQKRMQTNPCQILVATPGRLRDHIENTPGFCTRLMGVKVLVLDEADRLLDMGFRTDIEKIVSAVPKQRQTLLFSATVPDEVRQICYMAMKRDLEFINTVEEGSEETHSQVKQMHLVAPLEKQYSLLYNILKEHIADNVDYKVIIFCTTAMMTKLVADLLSELKLNIREIHSRKPQSYRTRVSKEFKESKGLILVSSDVSARGVDYPNVTLVMQLGVPADREQYIHRLGRTGRRGKEGTGILILAPWEDFFLSSIKDLPLSKAPLPSVDLDTKKKVERALAHVELKNKESAYQAWLGYYNSIKNIGRDKNQLVSLANEFSRSMGLDNPPAISKLVLRKMGLNNVPGLRAK